MRQFYDITTKIKDTLEAHSQVNVVTTGDVYDVDLNKQTIFPLSHIMVNQASFEGQVVRMSISIICMDLVDETKENPRDQAEPFYGINNVQDILNTQLAVINDVVQELRRGQLYSDLYQLDGNPTCLPFTERFENLLAGWTASIDVLLSNTEISVC
jgi:GTP cyclohydrolase III